jgi:hypothetical protein
MTNSPLYKSLAPFSPNVQKRAAALVSAFSFVINSGGSPPQPNRAAASAPLQKRMSASRINGRNFSPAISDECGYKDKKYPNNRDF